MKERDKGGHQASESFLHDDDEIYTIGGDVITKLYELCRRGPVEGYVGN